MASIAEVAASHRARARGVLGKAFAAVRADVPHDHSVGCDPAGDVPCIMAARPDNLPEPNRLPHARFDIVRY